MRGRLEQLTSGLPLGLGMYLRSMVLDGDHDMKILLVTLLFTLICVVYVGWILRIRKSREAIVKILENELAGTVDDTEWDFFLSMRLKDLALDQIRQKCIAVDVLPSSERSQELKKILDSLAG